jgi:N-acetylmuramoyl-L-alanine amidase
MIIALDPGHGGTDRKNVGPTGYVEADGVLDIALACRDELQNIGHEVMMTRETDETLSIRERADLINISGADIAVSIHTNAFEDPQVRGVEIIHSIIGGRGERLAEIFLNRLAQDLDLPKRRIFSREGDNGKDYYGIIRETVMPCVIVEVEFHTNPKAEQLLKDPVFRKNAGLSIARGIKEFFEGDDSNLCEV